MNLNIEKFTLTIISKFWPEKGLFMKAPSSLSRWLGFWFVVGTGYWGQPSFAQGSPTYTTVITAPAPAAVIASGGLPVTVNVTGTITVPPASGPAPYMVRANIQDTSTNLAPEGGATPTATVTPGLYKFTTTITSSRAPIPGKGWVNATTFNSSYQQLGSTATNEFVWK